MKTFLTSLISLLFLYLFIFYAFILLIVLDFGELPLDDYSAKIKYSYLKKYLDFYIDIVIYLWIGLTISIIISWIKNEFNKHCKVGLFALLTIALHLIFDPFLTWYAG